MATEYWLKRKVDVSHILKPNEYYYLPEYEYILVVKAELSEARRTLLEITIDEFRPHLPPQQ